MRSDLPEFLAWALVCQAESGDQAKVALARDVAGGIASPRLQARVQALQGGQPLRRGEENRLRKGDETGRIRRGGSVIGSGGQA